MNTSSLALVTLLQDRFDSDSADYNATLNGLTTMANNMVPPYSHSFDKDGRSYSQYGFRANRFSLLRAIGVASLLDSARGESFANYAVYIEVTSPQDSVPVGVPNRSYLDENQIEQVHTWESWILPNFEILHRDNRYFVPSDGNQGNGHIPLNQLLTISGQLVAAQDLPTN